MSDDKKISIDLTTATADELETVKSQILKRLAERAKVGSSRMMAEGGYDRHGSGHSRS